MKSIYQINSIFVTIHPIYTQQNPPPLGTKKHCLMLFKKNTRTHAHTMRQMLEYFFTKTGTGQRPCFTLLDFNTALEE